MSLQYSVASLLYFKSLDHTCDVIMINIIACVREKKSMNVKTSGSNAYYSDRLVRWHRALFSTENDFGRVQTKALVATGSEGERGGVWLSRNLYRLFSRLFKQKHSTPRPRTPTPITVGSLRFTTLLYRDAPSTTIPTYALFYTVFCLPCDVIVPIPARTGVQINAPCFIVITDEMIICIL